MGTKQCREEKRMLGGQMELFYLNCSPHLNLSLFVSDDNSVKNMNASIYIYKELTMFQTCDTQVEEGV